MSFVDPTGLDDVPSEWYTLTFDTSGLSKYKNSGYMKDTNLYYGDRTFYCDTINLNNRNYTITGTIQNFYGGSTNPWRKDYMGTVSSYYVTTSDNESFTYVDVDYSTLFYGLASTFSAGTNLGNGGVSSNRFQFLLPGLVDNDEATKIAFDVLTNYEAKDSWNHLLTAGVSAIAGKFGDASSGVIDFTCSFISDELDIDYDYEIDGTTFGGLLDANKSDKENDGSWLK